MYYPSRDSIAEAANLLLQKFDECVSLVSALKDGANVPSSIKSAASTAAAVFSGTDRNTVLAIVTASNAVVAGGDNTPIEKKPS